MTRELSQIGDSEGQRDLGVMSELSDTHLWPGTQKVEAGG